MSREEAARAFAEQIAKSEDAIFAFMRDHPGHPLTQKLVPQIRANLDTYGQSFMDDELSNALLETIAAANKDK